MSLCPNSGGQCECQPQDGVMCPHGPTPPFEPWKPEAMTHPTPNDAMKDIERLARQFGLACYVAGQRQYSFPRMTGLTEYAALLAAIGKLVSSTQPAMEPAGWHISFDGGKTWEYRNTDPDGKIGDCFAIVRPLVYGDGADWRDQPTQPADYGCVMHGIAHPCEECAAQSQDAQPVAPNDVIAFLLGEAPLDGVWFSEKHPTERGAFWWRKHLRSQVQGGLSTNNEEMK
jgi:hypothetical protein